MSVQFEKSGVLRTETKIASIASTKQGTWKLIGYDSVTAIMQVECTLATQTTVHEIEFEDADTIRWIPPNLAGTTQNLKFVREK